MHQLRAQCPWLEPYPRGQKGSPLLLNRPSDDSRKEEDNNRKRHRSRVSKLLNSETARGASPAGNFGPEGTLGTREGAGVGLPLSPGESGQRGEGTTSQAWTLRPGLPGGKEKCDVTCPLLNGGMFQESRAAWGLEPGDVREAEVLRPCGSASVNSDLPFPRHSRVTCFL